MVNKFLKVKKLLILMIILLVTLFSFEKTSYAASDAEKINFDRDEIVSYVDSTYQLNSDSGLGTTLTITESAEVIQAWRTTLNNYLVEYVGVTLEQDTQVNLVLLALNNNSSSTVNYDSDSSSSSSSSSSSGSSTIYKLPQRQNSGNTASSSLDDMISDAEDFVSSGGDIQYDQDALQNVSSSIYNILLTIGIVVAVIVGGIMGIKLMLSSVEEKAETKKLLVAYVVGCVIIFGGFGIWKLIITILEGM